MASQLAQRVAEPKQQKAPPAFIDTSAYSKEMVHRNQMPPLLEDEVSLATAVSPIPEKRRTSPRVADLRRQMRSKLLSTLSEADEYERDDPEAQKTILERMKVFLQRNSIQVTRAEFEEVAQAVLDDLLGFGAIEPLIRDNSYTEIMVNGPDIIFGERKGKLLETEFTFDDEEHLYFMTQRIVRRIGRSFDRQNPMTDARLPDGSRVHLILPPSALQGTTVTIRKFPEKVLTAQDLVSFGTLTPEVAEFLEACVVARLNIVVSGGTGSGKTTLLNVLSSFIPEDERIVTIEDSAELQLAQRHVVRLETTPPAPDGDGEAGCLTIRDLVKGSLRMRPDRIVIGECRSGEALDMLQAMNTGHDGSLTTVHSNSARDSISRLETLALMSGMDLPVSVIRKQIGSAVQLIIQQSRLKDGSRKIIQVTEVQGMEGEQITLQDIFIYKTPDHHGIGPSHNGGGQLMPTGFRPKFMERLEQAGFKLSAKIFGANTPRTAE